jgi:hypothetical protein
LCQPPTWPDVQPSCLIIAPYRPISCPVVLFPPPPDPPPDPPLTAHTHLPSPSIFTSHFSSLSSAPLIGSSLEHTTTRPQSFIHLASPSYSNRPTTSPREAPSRSALRDCASRRCFVPRANGYTTASPYALVIYTVVPSREPVSSSCLSTSPLEPMPRPNISKTYLLPQPTPHSHHPYHPPAHVPPTMQK